MASRKARTPQRTTAHGERAREKARAQSSGALREEARRDPPNPARLTCGERIGPYTGKTRAGVASFARSGLVMATRTLRRRGRTPGHRERALRRRGNRRVRPLSKSTSERGRGTRASPALSRKMKRSAASFPPFRERTRGGAPAQMRATSARRNRAGRPAPARNTRRRAGGASRPPDPAHLQRALGRSTTHPARSRRHLRPRRALFPSRRAAGVRRVRHFFRLFPDGFFFVFLESRRSKSRTLRDRPLLFSRAFVSAARARAAAAAGRARPRRLCSRTWLSRALRASRPEFDPRARRRAAPDAGARLPAAAPGDAKARRRRKPWLARSAEPGTRDPGAAEPASSVPR